MKVYLIKQIEKGRSTDQLKRKNAFGKFLAKEECSFAIIGRERSIDLEASSEAEREKWVHALEILVEYKKAQKAQNSQFSSR